MEVYILNVGIYVINDFSSIAYKRKSFNPYFCALLGGGGILELDGQAIKKTLYSFLQYITPTSDKNLVMTRLSLQFRQDRYIITPCMPTGYPPSFLAKQVFTFLLPIICLDNQFCPG